MPQWQIGTALGITLLVALTTHLFYRRPPKVLWPALPCVFLSALIFSLGDLVANLWADNATIRWVGMQMVYTGLLTIAPGWWLFTRGFSEMTGYRKVAFRSGLPVLVAINTLLWLGLVTNPWHGQFLETRAFARSDYGPLWYATAFVNYSALMAAMVVHAKEAFVVKDPTVRSQCRFLVAAVAIPMIMNMVYVFSPVALSYDPTALGFALSCVLFLFAVERRDLFVLERVSLPSVLDNDADPIVIVSPRQQLLYANPNAEKLFGKGVLTRGAPIGELLESTVPTFSLEQPDSHSNAPDAHLFISASREERWVAIEVSTVEKSRGVEAGLCLRIRDRTALRAAQIESEEHVALLEALDLAIGEGILVKDQNGEIRYLNEAFASLWGMNVKEMLEMDQLLHSHLGGMLVDLPSKSMQRMWHIDKEHFDPTHTETCDVSLQDDRILEVSTMPIRTPKGFSGRAWRMTDVSKARRDSRAIIHSQKLEGLGLIAGGIAHDFNNLLMSILGNAEIVRETVDSDSPIQNQLERVETAATTAAELTGQLLAYAGKTSFMKESVDISQLLVDVTDLVSVTLSKNIEMVFRLDKSLPPVRGGPTQLRQVIMNLVTNAAEAIDDAGGTISIETGRGRPDRMSGATAIAEHGNASGDLIYCSVSDNGAGMDAATLEKIFDPFFTTKFTGRGLGMAATRGILESHEGQLRIESKLGQGSTFTLSLPCVTDSPDLPVIDDKDVVSERFENRKVLVVDDEAPIRAILRSHLVAAGFDVHVASDGGAAVAAVEEIGPALDLVLLDVMMPGLSGIETRELIRKMRPELTIVMSSGHSEEALQDLDGWNSIRDGFIQKPYRSKALLDQIESLIS